MARINTSNPLVRAPARHRATPDEKTERPASVLSDSPDSSRNGNTSLFRGSSQRKKPGPGAMFDIFPDPAIESGSSASNTPRKQIKRRTLKTTQVNSLLLPIQRPRQRPSVKVETDDYDKENDIAEESFTEAPATSMEPVPQLSPARQNRHIPRSPGRSRPDHRPLREIHSETEEEDDCGNYSLDSLEDFIVSDNEDISYHETSQSETEPEKAPTPPPPPKSTRKRLLRGRKPNTGTNTKVLNDNPLKAPFPLETKISDAIKSHSSPMEAPKHLFQDDFHLSSKLNELILGDGNESAAQLETVTSPTVIDLDSPAPELNPSTKGLETPPSSPSRNCLRSPTKEKIRIPPTPHRESVDAFWSQTETNLWIDQHSPRKEKTPKRSVIDLLKDFDVSDEENSSPDSSISLESDSMSRESVTPPKTRKASKTPSKTAIKKAEADAKRAAKARRDSFNNKKANFAETFLEILDNAVSGGKVNLLAKPTGGVKITWSKTLQKTAGRAQWRSERVETRDPDGQRTGASQHIHHATIELAERIIDDEYRLINTLAHEYCHLANFMVSRVTDNPHGNSFKNWGKLCAEKLKDHPIYGGQINVTTKHSYQIDWKYVWVCTGCAVTYGRHSKSIDTERQRCGSCKHRLEQIKPKPRMSPQKKAMAQVTKSLAQVQVEM
ncbi:BolA protein [Penicillium atrosanguineum]|uniref:BolA protein n=1 Tax=Penicillium atrosanguineum TaxID=1132637 RepID=UPI00239DB743|nr:BolA protein [Penicillium atrosanguineum]KAJ5125381.1 hypothetical protein N7526_007558 [Penicillium atrosanguineum]KAJ5292499.1 BolA protein [Penicillium atrosanguineum]